jgi:hypothetical protein
MKLENRDLELLARECARCCDMARVETLLSHLDENTARKVCNRALEITKAELDNAKAERDAFEAWGAEKFGERFIEAARASAAREP